MNALALAQHDIDISEDDLRYKVKYHAALQEAFQNRGQFLEIVNLSTQLSNKLRELMGVNKTWEYVLGGLNNYDLESDVPNGEWANRLAEYAECYVEVSGD